MIISDFVFLISAYLLTAILIWIVATKIASSQWLKVSAIEAFKDEEGAVDGNRMIMAIFMFGVLYTIVCSVVFNTLVFVLFLFLISKG